MHPFPVSNSTKLIGSPNGILVVISLWAVISSLFGVGRGLFESSQECHHTTIPNFLALHRDCSTFPIGVKGPSARGPDKYCTIETFICCFFGLLLLLFAAAMVTLDVTELPAAACTERASHHPNRVRQKASTNWKHNHQDTESVLFLLYMKMYK